MANAHRFEENVTERVEGPAFAPGPEFQRAFEIYIARLGSQSLETFAHHWLAAVKGDRLPSWQSFQPHMLHSLVLSTFLLERPAGSTSIRVGFVGNAIVEALGGDVTGKLLDEIDNGYALNHWNGACARCLDQHAITDTTFDLGFAGREFKMATAILFPLQPHEGTDQLCGHILWRN